jgi:hypothetical protein
VTGDLRVRILERFNMQQINPPDDSGFAIRYATLVTAAIGNVDAVAGQSARVLSGEQRRRLAQIERRPTVLVDPFEPALVRLLDPFERDDAVERLGRELSEHAVLVER